MRRRSRQRLARVPRPRDPAPHAGPQALTAGDVMSSQLVTLPVVLRIRDLVEVLRRWAGGRC